MKKVKYIIETLKTFSIIIYIDYLITIQIFRQITLFTSFIDKFNLKFIRVFQYFFEYNFIIRHKIDKKNVIFDAFSRF